MKKTINTLLLTIVLLPTALVACGHSHQDSIGFGLTFSRAATAATAPETNKNDIHVAAFQYGADTTVLNSILTTDAYISQVIKASAAGIGLTTILTIIIAKLIEYVKNAKIRETKREIEIARLKAELARIQPTSITAA